MLHRILCLASCSALIAFAAPTASAKPHEPGPQLQTPVATLQQAFACSDDLSGARRDPVLLVHGTFADSDINWSWNYGETLPARGEPTCTVDLPDLSAGDIQVSTEYVVYAIRAMAREGGRRVGVIGFSQGGLEARWALRWWPDLRHRVSDLIMLNTPNQGSIFPDGVCTAPYFCAASMYQMRSDSVFLAALNGGRQAAGAVPSTAIVSNDDEIFVLPAQGELYGHGRNITSLAVQDLCPDHHFQPAEFAHVSLAFDGPAYAIVTDALDHKGPAKLSRIDPDAACSQPTMPGVTLDEAFGKLTQYASQLADLLGPAGPKAQGEPELACYVTRTCPGGGASLDR
jgi:pimeloyl-ACP methyl ester carboxylesterase